MKEKINIIDDFSDCVLTPEMKAQVVKEDLELTAYFNSCKKEEREDKINTFDDCALTSSAIEQEEENFDDCVLTTADIKIKEVENFDDCMRTYNISEMEENYDDCKKGAK